MFESIAPLRTVLVAAFAALRLLQLKSRLISVLRSGGLSIKAADFILTS